MVHMATIYRRGEIWWARWYRNDGTRTSKTTGLRSKREAKTVAASLEADDLKRHRLQIGVQEQCLTIVEEAANLVRRGRFTSQRAKEMLEELNEIANPTYKAVSVRQWAEDWLKVQRATKNTIQNYRSGLDLFLGGLGRRADRLLKDLEPSHVEAAFADARRANPDLKASTVNIGVSAVRRAMVWAVKQRWIAFSPAESLKNFQTLDSDSRAPFTTEEVSRLAGYGEGGEWTGLVILGAHTGIRIGDLRSLNSSQIAAGHVILKPKKTIRMAKMIRIPLSQSCLEWIGEREGPLFQELSTWSTARASNYFKRIMVRCDVPEWVETPGVGRERRSFHSLRHSFTSWLAEADVLPDVRQKLTGHSSAKVHAGYTHHDKALVRAIKKLPSL